MDPIGVQDTIEVEPWEFQPPISWDMGPRTNYGEIYPLSSLELHFQVEWTSRKGPPKL